jgi:PAS domain S-box-containing protein
MASRKRFSRFIAWTMVIFEGVSLTLVVGILYATLSNSMDHEFYNKLQIQEKEVSMALSDRLNQLETRIREISLNNAVRVNLMLGMKNQLFELMVEQYPFANGAFFFIKEKESSTFIPELPGSLVALRPYLQELCQKKGLQKIEFQDFGDGLFFSVFSIPINRKDDCLGTAYVVYDLSQDTHFLQRILTKSYSKLLAQTPGHLIDIHTGQSRTLPEGIRDLAAIGFDHPTAYLFPNENLVPLEMFPGLFYAASSEPLQKEKSSLIFKLVFLCAAIFLLTLLVSFLIARKMSDPLDSMANQALEIAREPSNPSIHLQEGKLDYVEFHKLAHAFNQVLMSLLETQEKLRRRAKELDASEKRYRSLVETSPIGILSTDKDWKIIFANQTLEEITHYSQADLCSMHLWDMVNADERDRIRQTGENYLRQGTQKGWEIYWIRKDGQPIWVELQAARIEEVGKQAILVNVMDVTEQKQAREEKKDLQIQLQHAQKMEAIGTLAGGIAHDFNNILLPIIGYTEMAMLDVPQDSLIRKNLGEVLKAADLAKGLVQQILTFSRRSEKERKPLKIQPIIKQSLKLLRASLPTTIEIRHNIDDDCGAILGDPTQIYQVMMNICTNAYHAMREKGGIMEVTLTEMYIDSPDLIPDLDLNPGQYLRLAVSDTGHGMAREVVERIFDPYFTTKGMGEGTGLGLSVVHGIVRSHDGYITVYSEPNEGTTFHIYLPRIEVSAEVPEIISTELAPKGKEHILFVDDEEQIANVVQQILERLGYHVAARTSSVEALEAFQAQPEKFDLVITDLTMPNMTGTELAKRLIDIRSDIPIILCTGFSEAISRERARAIGIREYVMKPINTHDLAKTIRKALNKDEG